MTLNFSYKQNTKPNPQEKRSLPKPPPKTCDEWLTSSSGIGHLVSADGTLCMPSTKDGVIKWPIHPPHLDYLVDAPALPGDEGKTIKARRKHESPRDTILGTLDEIKEDLKTHAPWDPSLWDDVEMKLKLLESSVTTSADNFVAEEPRSPKASLIEGLANISDLTFMTELSEELLSLQKQNSSRRHTKAKDSHMRDDSELLQERNKTGDEVDSILLGLSEDTILLSLPGKLDALSILDLVHGAAKIPQFLMEAWKRVFFCSETVAFLQNAFWWTWLDYFKPKRWMQSLLFNQLADDFILILNKMEGKYKDEVFMRFPVYLAQALYSIFCQAFPSSNQELNRPEFLDYLSNTMSEWILGVQSQPNQWERWPRHILNPHFHEEKETKKRSEEKKEQKTEVDRKLSFADKDMMNLSRNLSHLLISKPSSITIREPTIMMVEPNNTFLSFDKGARTESSSTDTLTSSNFSFSKLEKGPVFECVRFNLHGRSPLLQHFLYHHNFTDFKTHPGLTVSRTQIKEFPICRFTYKQVIQAQKRKAQKLYEEYKSHMAQSERDISLDRSKFKPRPNQINALESIHQARGLSKPGLQ